MRTLRVLVVLLALTIALPAAADPGTGDFTSGTSATSLGTCNRLAMGGSSKLCNYVFTTATNSKTFVVVPGATIQVCLNADVNIDNAVATATIAVREVAGTAFDDGSAPRADDLVLDGTAPSNRCIRRLWPGTYWIEVVTPPGGGETAVVALKAN